MVFPNGILMGALIEQVWYVAHAGDMSAITETIKSEEPVSVSVWRGQILDTVKETPLHSCAKAERRSCAGSRSHS